MYFIKFYSLFIPWKSWEKVFETSKDRNTKISKLFLLGYSKSSSKSEVYKNKHLYQEKRSEINNQTLYLKKLEKEQIKCKVSGRNEGNNENQSENRQHKDDRKKSMKLRLTFLKRQNWQIFGLTTKEKERRLEQMESEVKEEILQLLIQKY